MTNDIEQKPLWMTGYYTLVVSWVPVAFQTEWHPDAETGPFSVISRGAFRTLEEALAWGRDRLGGTPYTVKFIPGVEE